MLERVMFLFCLLSVWLDNLKHLRRDLHENLLSGSSRGKEELFYFTLCDRNDLKAMDKHADVLKRWIQSLSPPAQIFQFRLLVLSAQQQSNTSVSLSLIVSKALFRPWILTSSTPSHLLKQTSLPVRLHISDVNDCVATETEGDFQLTKKEDLVGGRRIKTLKTNQERKQLSMQLSFRMSVNHVSLSVWSPV